MRIERSADACRYEHRLSRGRDRANNFGPEIGAQARLRQRAAFGGEDDAEFIAANPCRETIPAADLFHLRRNGKQRLVADAMTV
jgi:hypothetical protein